MLSKSWMLYVVVNGWGEFLNSSGFFVDDAIDIRTFDTELEADNAADLYNGVVMSVRLTLEEQE